MYASIAGALTRQAYICIYIARRPVSLHQRALSLQEWLLAVCVRVHAVCACLGVHYARTRGIYVHDLCELYTRQDSARRPTITIKTKLKVHQMLVFYLLISGLKRPILTRRVQQAPLGFKTPLLDLIMLVLI